MTNLTEFLDCLTKNIDNFEKIIKALKEMEEAAEKEHEENLRMKTTCTVTSTIGTVGTVASVALAPFTGGISVAAAAFIGTACSLAGGVGNMVADYTDSQFQKEQAEKLNAFMKELQILGEALDEKLKVFNSCVTYLNNEGFDEDCTLRTIISSLASNALRLAPSPMMYLVGSVVNNAHGLKLINSKEALPDLSKCTGMVIKDLKRNQIVLDLDQHNNILNMDPDLEKTFHGVGMAVTGTLNYIQTLNAIEDVIEVGVKVGAAGVKPMATATGEILKSVQISAKEAASLGLKTAEAGGKATETAAKTAGLLSYAAVGFSVAVTIYEIGSLINEYGKGNVLKEEITKMIDFCTAKLKYLQKLKRKCLEEEKKDDDKECTCKSIKLKVLYFNGRSINSETKTQQAKLAKIRELLYIHYPNIVAISETWLDYEKDKEDKKKKKKRKKEENDLIALFQFAGFTIFRQDRNDDNPFSMFSCLGSSGSKRRKGGGLLVAFRTIEFEASFKRFLHLDYKDNLMNFEGRYEYSCNKCPRPLGKKFFKFSFILGYRPPNLSSREDRMLKEAMKDNCAKMCNYDGWAFVADFNCGSQGFESFLESIDLNNYPHTNFPVTHVNGNGLDQVVYYKEDFVRDARVLDTRVSDHYTVLFNMELGKDYTSDAVCSAEICNSA